MMKRIAFIFFSAFSLCFAVPLYVYADETASLDSFIEEALNNNPKIQAAHKQYEAAANRIGQAISLDDPMIEYEYNKIVADRMLTGEPMRMFSASQEIPFPTKIYFRAKMASRIAKVEYETYKATERDIIAQVKSVYSELLLIDKLISLNKENKAILDQFSKVATTRYGTSEGSQADALKAQLELAKADNELIMLEQRRLSNQARLNVLLSRDPKQELGILIPEEAVRLAKSLDEFYSLARQNNPELKAYNYGVEKGQAALNLSRQEFLPDFKVKFTQMVDEGRREADAWAGMLGVTIPLWAHKQIFGVKEMEAELGSLRAEYKMKENMVLFDIRDAYARAEANIKLVELYETAFIPQAEQTVQAALKGYESRSADFLNLLDSQRMLIEFKIEHYKAILELRLALADLEKAAGTDVNFE